MSLFRNLTASALPLKTALVYHLDVSTFILLSALPGSGKSTWSKKYKELHPNTYIISSDETRKRVAGSVNTFNKEPEVWEAFLKDIQSHGKLGGEDTVIADATNLTNEYRKFYRENTGDFDRHIIVYFDIPYEICLVQNRMREPERVVPDYAMERMKEEFEPLSEEVKAMYDEVIILGPDFISPYIEALKKSEVL